MQPSDDPPTTTEELVVNLTESCSASMPRRCQSARYQVYWWTGEIADLRRSTLRVRRKYVRTMKSHPENILPARERLKEAKRPLRSAINPSKNSAGRGFAMRSTRMYGERATGSRKDQSADRASL